MDSVLSAACRVQRAACCGLRAVGCVLLTMCYSLHATGFGLHNMG